jgi:hypothetical protein
MSLSIKKTGRHHVNIVKREQTTPSYFVGAIAFTWKGVTYKYRAKVAYKAPKKINFEFIAL